MSLPAAEASVAVLARLLLECDREGTSVAICQIDICSNTIPSD